MNGAVSWLIPREELTREQVRAIEMDPKEHRVILGGPGSGKTQILLHRGRFLQEAFRVAPERFRIFVYTNALRTYIHSALNLLDLPDDSVSTLDAWCGKFHTENIGRRLPWNKEAKCRDFGTIREAVVKKISESGNKPFDFVLVDEAQDLDATALKLLKAMSNHVTVCADHKQQLYDHGSEISEILRTLGVKRSNVTLLETYRCCPYIVSLAAELIDDPTEREQYVRQLKTSQAERETPLLYCASDAEDETRQMIDLARTRLNKGERVAVLFPQKRQAFGYAKALEEAGIQAENPNDLDFTTDKPKLMPYHSAKGLTFDSVILPRLTPRSFGTMSTDRIKHLLFVGITRAIKWAAMITTQSNGFAPLARLTPPAGLRCLTVRKHGDSSAATANAKGNVEDDDGLDIL